MFCLLDGRGKADSWDEGGEAKLVQLPKRGLSLATSLLVEKELSVSLPDRHEAQDSPAGSWVAGLPPQRSSGPFRVPVRVLPGSRPACPPFTCLYMSV